MLKILVVDNADMAGILQDAFEFDKHEVQIAYNGQEALQLLEASEILPDIIFAYLYLPVMHGLDLLNHVRANPRWRDIRFILRGYRKLDVDAIVIDTCFDLGDILAILAAWDKPEI